MTSSDVTDITRIRNFAIIAHIDHGKSTLSDRMIQITGALSAREMQDQVLDSMDIERERGITIKAQTVRLFHTYATGEKYVLNFPHPMLDKRSPKSVPQPLDLHQRAAKPLRLPSLNAIPHTQNQRDQECLSNSRHTFPLLHTYETGAQSEL
jgi:hypothetical protein